MSEKASELICEICGGTKDVFYFGVCGKCWSERTKNAEVRVAKLDAEARRLRGCLRIAELVAEAAYHYVRCRQAGHMTCENYYKELTQALDIWKEGNR